MVSPVAAFCGQLDRTIALQSPARTRITRDNIASLSSISLQQSALAGAMCPTPYGCTNGLENYMIKR